MALATFYGSPDSSVFGESDRHQRTSDLMITFTEYLQRLMTHSCVSVRREASRSLLNYVSRFADRILTSFQSEVVEMDAEPKEAESQREEKLDVDLSDVTSSLTALKKRVEMAPFIDSTYHETDKETSERCLSVTQKLLRRECEKSGRSFAWKEMLLTSSSTSLDTAPNAGKTDVVTHTSLTEKLRGYFAKLSRSRSLSPALAGAVTSASLFLNRSKMSLDVSAREIRDEESTVFSRVQECVTNIRLTSSTRWLYQSPLAFGFCVLMSEVCDDLGEIHHKSQGNKAFLQKYPTLPDLWSVLLSQILGWMSKDVLSISENAAYALAGMGVHMASIHPPLSRHIGITSEDSFSSSLNILFSRNSHVTHHSVC
jgi:hypothetical protein